MSSEIHLRAFRVAVSELISEANRESTRSSSEMFCPLAPAHVQVAGRAFHSAECTEGQSQGPGEGALNREGPPGPTVDRYIRRCVLHVHARKVWTVGQTVRVLR